MTGMTGWMLYALATGALFGGAALALERVLRARRRETRWVWLAALAASVAWPFVALLGAWRASGPAQPDAQTTTLLPAVVVRAGAAAQDVGVSLAERLGWAEPALLMLWLVASVMLLQRLEIAHRRLGRLRATWREREVRGRRVLVSRDVGPAVIGVRSSTIVLPEWVLAFDAPLLELVLRHEEAHCRARDPLWRTLAAVLGALFPWNLALRWQSRRLRLAAEIDCDARTLDVEPRADRYGRLLLAIAQHRSPSRVFAAALSEPASQLERRLDAMQKPARPRAVATLALTAVAASAIVVACTSEAPTSVGRTARPMVAAPVSERPTMTAAGQPYFEFQVEKQVVPIPGNSAPRYPDELRRAQISGGVLAQFVVDTTGRAEMSTFKVLKRSHEDFVTAVASALPNWKFRAAEVGGKKVKQVVQMPFHFALTKDDLAVDELTRGSAKAATPVQGKSVEVRKLDPVVIKTP